MFLVNPTAPSVLYIQGLPIDTPTPPTPTSSSGPAQLPVANLVAMGIAKLVGDPFTFAHKAHKQRSGLLTDLVPEPEKSLKNNAALAFHQVRKVLATGGSKCIVQHDNCPSADCCSVPAVLAVLAVLAALQPALQAANSSVADATGDKSLTNLDHVISCGSSQRPAEQHC